MPIVPPPRIIDFPAPKVPTKPSGRFLLVSMRLFLTTVREKMSDPTASQYRQNAEDCRLNADLARSSEQKHRWLKVAADWQELADRIDQRSHDRQGGIENSPAQAAAGT